MRTIRSDRYSWTMAYVVQLDKKIAQLMYWYTVYGMNPTNLEEEKSVQNPNYQLQQANCIPVYLKSC
jgi:hypothetical protein